MKQSAINAKHEAEVLDKEINTPSTLHEATLSVQRSISTDAEAGQLAKYQVDVIVALTKFQTMLKAAETDIQHTQQKNHGSNIIATEMKKLVQRVPEELSKYIGSLHSSAEVYFKSASRAAEDVKTTDTSILALKNEITNMRARIKAETDVEEAKKLVDSSNSYANQVSQHLLKAKEKMDASTKSVTNAHSLYEAAVGKLKKKGINVEALLKSNYPMEDAAQSPEMIANTIYVSIQLILPLIACVNFH